MNSSMYLTPLYAAVLSLVFLAISVRTFRLRRKLRITVGDNGNELMLRAMRVHANFAEYVPLILLLTWMLERQGAPLILIHFTGLSLLIGRIAHAYGVAQVNENFRFRTIGMTLTFIALIASALGILILFVTSYL